MKSQAKHFWAMLALLVVGGAVVNFWAAAGEARVPRRALAEFPSEVGAWRQVGRDERFDAATETVLRADDYVSREYVTGDGQTASLRIVDFETHEGTLEELYRAYMAKKRTSPDEAEALREQRLMAIALDKMACAGCHTTEFNTAFAHVAERFKGQGAAHISEFLRKELPHRAYHLFNVANAGTVQSVTFTSNGPSLTINGTSGIDAGAVSQVS